MNQNLEQQARDNIDRQLQFCGWVVQGIKEINLGANIGVAVQQYQPKTGPVDYMLFVDKKPLGAIETKAENEGLKLTVVEEQSADYATSKLKYLNDDALPFVYESTCAVPRFTDYTGRKPRARPVLIFHTSQTFAAWIKQATALRSRLLHNDK